MRRRLRKKLHKGEFREFGFEVELALKDDVSEGVFNQRSESTTSGSGAVGGSTS